MDFLYSLEKLKEFDNHKCVIPLADIQSGLKGFIAIHRTCFNNPSFGATRFWQYDSEIQALQDGLKLSRTMSYKAALADLKHGGAKGIIWAQKHQSKKDILKAYLKIINLLKGGFITGADVGIDQNDLLFMKRQSPDCIVGLKADAPKFTALGLYYSIKLCLKEIFGSDSLAKKTFAIQGLGKIGTELLKMIYPEAGQVFATDINQKTIALIKKDFPKIKIVAPEQIYFQKANVFSPCALSNVLNDKTISQLRCQIVVGGANNQLADSHAGEQLRKQGVVYGPDYVVNAGGLISVVDEFENKEYSAKRISDKVFKIRQKLKQIMTESKKTKKATNLIADQMAQNIVKKHSE